MTSLLALNACTTYEVIDHSRAALGSRDAGPIPDADGDAREPDPTPDGLPARLVIDASVHTGTYANGTRYEGIYGEVIDYGLDKLPVDATLALLHVGILAQRAELSIDAHDALTHVLLRGRIDCGTRGVTGGCFMLVDDPHLRELGEFDRERFGDIDQATLTQGSFGLGAMALVWRIAYDEALFGDYIDEPRAFFGALEDPTDRARYAFFAHVYSAYSPQIVDALSECGAQPLRDCLLELDRTQPGQADLIDAHTNISSALRSAPRAEIRVTREHARAYLEGIAPFRTETGSWIPSLIERTFGAREAITSYEQAREMLEAATDAVGAPPTPESIRTVLCARSILRGPPACE